MQNGKSASRFRRGSLLELSFGGGLVHPLVCSLVKDKARSIRGRVKRD